jgi:hypothetical protein
MNMAEDQKNGAKRADKTLNRWLTGLLLLILFCVAIPELFPGLSWMYWLFPAGVMIGPVALMLLDRRPSQGKPPGEDTGRASRTKGPE